MGPIMTAMYNQTSLLKSPKVLAREFPIYPVLGLVGVIFGTFLATSLIPIDPLPAGALFHSALTMTLGIIAAPMLACFRNPRTLFRVEHILVFSPIYWLLLDLLQGAYPLERVSKQSIENSFLAICLFVCGVWIAALFKPLPLPSFLEKASSYIIEPKVLFRLVLIFFSLSFLRFAIPSNFDPVIMFDGLVSARWNAPWARGQLGDWDSFLDHLAYFGYVLPTLTVLIVQKTGWRDRRVVFSIFLSLVITAFLAQGGGRRIVGVIIGSAIICWIIQQKSLNLFRIIGLIVALGLLLTTMQLMLEYRNEGVQVELRGESKRLQYEYLHIDDNFLRLTQIIEIVPTIYPYVYEKQIIFVLIRPIPRVFWPGKPIDPGFDLPTAIGAQGVSLSSSSIGEFYLSGGMYAVFAGGLVYGILAHMVSLLLLRLRGDSGVLVYSLSTLTLFAGMRSLQELMLMSYSVLAWVVISRIIIKKKMTAKGSNLSPATSSERNH
jgi:oligosaccharide repeat unit polymerase